MCYSKAVARQYALGARAPLLNKQKNNKQTNLRILDFNVNITILLSHQMVIILP
jgi:hypothetical protein